MANGIHLDNAGAMRLKATIVNYWERRGFPVQVNVVPADEGLSGYVLRSDLVNGWPRELYRRWYGQQVH